MAASVKKVIRVELKLIIISRINYNRINTIDYNASIGVSQWAESVKIRIELIIIITQVLMKIYHQ